VIAHLRNRTLVSSLAHRFDTSVDIDGSNATLPPRLGANAPGHASGAASDQASANSSIIDAAGATGRRVNKWFNLDLEDIDGTKSEVKFWRNAAIKCAATLSATQPAANPPTMFIEVCLDVSALPPGAELQVTDIFGRPWTVDLESGGSGFVSAPPPRRPASRQGGYRQPLHTQHESRQRHASTIVLEVWRLDLATNQLPQPVPDLPRVYKQAIIFFRSLYAFASLLPTMSLIKRLHGTQEPEDLDVFCSVRPDLSPRDGVLDLDVSFTGTERFLESYQFEPVATPMGAFLMSVQYRRECGFMYNPAMYEQQLGDMPGIGAIDDT
ncbi:autophagy protein 13, partial [Linderina macrospora]